MANPAVVDNALDQIRQQKAREMMNEIRDRYGEGTLAAIISGDPNYRASVTRDSYPTAGPYYSPAGVREAYEGYGIPPVLYQRSPFASAGFRSFVDPFGQMMVQPLVGFPSAYPHVLSGVPTNPMNVFQMAMQGMPFMPWMMGGWGGMPMMPQGGQAAPRGGSGTGTAKKPQTNTQPPTQSNLQRWQRWEANPLFDTGSLGDVPDVITENAAAPVIVEEPTATTQMFPGGYEVPYTPAAPAASALTVTQPSSAGPTGLRGAIEGFMPTPSLSMPQGYPSAPEASAQEAPLMVPQLQQIPVTPEPSQLGAPIPEAQSLDSALLVPPGATAWSATPNYWARLQGLA